MKTITAYEFHITKFMEWVCKTHLKITQKDIENYIIYLRKKGNSHSSINLSIAAIKFFFVKIMNRRFNIQSMKRQEKHTGVCSNEEIMKAIDSLKNDKHKLLLDLLYGSGLRVGEAVKIRHEDIDLIDREVIIRQGKGARDRKAILSKRFVEEYSFFKKNKGFVFEGRKAHLTIKSAQMIVKNAFKDKHVHPHMMRASFATHMLEAKVPELVIQRCTGHKNIKTLGIYTKYAKMPKVTSPIDM